MRAWLGLALLSACALEPIGWDEGDGEPVPVEVLTSEWTPEFVPGGQICVPVDGEQECCRIGVVEPVYTQAELDAVFDRLFEGSRRAPEVDFTLKLGMVVSNESCPGGAKAYVSDEAVHDGPDLVWNITFGPGERNKVGPGRSFLVGLTERRRYRQVQPNIDVTFF